MQSSSVLTLVSTVSQSLRWAAVPGLVYFAGSGLLYDVVRMLDFFTCPLFLLVVGGAKIAPRNRVATAVVLAAVLGAASFRGHVLMMGGPWWSWTIHYWHVTLEALGPALGVAYIFCLERASPMNRVAGVGALPPPAAAGSDSLLGIPGGSEAPTPATRRSDEVPVDAERSCRNPASALMAEKTVIRWLRWAVVLGLVYSSWTGQFFHVVHMVGNFFIPMLLFVAAGAKIAPRNHLAMAIILAAILIVDSFRGHVLALAPEEATSFQLMMLALVGNYRHFTQEALGAVLGVVYIFWSEKASPVDTWVAGDGASPPPAGAGSNSLLGSPGGGEAPTPATP